VLFGVLVRRHIPHWVVGGAAGIGLGLHLLFNLALGVANPAISATYGIFASLLFGVLGLFITRNEQAVHGAS
jgi:SSS family solute:Na+ symporter/sodium/pantothenate symporter